MTRIAWIAAVSIGFMLGGFLLYRHRQPLAALDQAQAPDTATHPMDLPAGSGGAGGSDPPLLPAPSATEGGVTTSPAETFPDLPPDPVAAEPMAADPYPGWQATPGAGTTNEATGGKLHGGGDTGGVVQTGGHAYADQAGGFVLEPDGAYEAVDAAGNAWFYKPGIGTSFYGKLGGAQFWAAGQAPGTVGGGLFASSNPFVGRGWK